MNAPIICLAGKNQIAVDALLFMVERGWKNRLLVCPNRTDDGASGWQPSLIRFAREFGIEVVTLNQVQELKELVFISLEFDRIVRPAAFRTDRLYNIHFSALPAYKGMYTSALPILYRAAVTGVTLHEIDHGIDTGAIIAQDIFPLPEVWTARDLYFAYMDHGFKLFRSHFDALVAETPPVAQPQPAVGSTYYSKASLDYRNLAVDLRDTADGVIRQLRAFSFREYQTPVVAGMQIGGWRTLPDRSLERPGTVLSEDDDSIVVATIDYDLRLDRNRTWEWFALDDAVTRDGLDPQTIDIADRNGWTPLIRAAYAGNASLCRRLLEASADPNKPNANGTTPLMYAFSSPDSAGGRLAARLLLASGADAARPDKFGRTLYDYHPGSRVIIEEIMDTPENRSAAQSAKAGGDTP